MGRTIVMNGTWWLDPLATVMTMHTSFMQTNNQDPSAKGQTNCVHPSFYGDPWTARKTFNFISEGTVQDIASSSVSGRASQRGLLGGTVRIC